MYPFYFSLIYGSIKLQTHGDCKCTLAPSSAMLVAAPLHKARAQKVREPRDVLDPPAGTVARVGSPGRRELGIITIWGTAEVGVARSRFSYGCAVTKLMSLFRITFRVWAANRDMERERSS